ncbi:hypothetical protein [Mycolicibacterium sp. XJ1819]
MTTNFFPGYTAAAAPRRTSRVWLVATLAVAVAVVAVALVGLSAMISKPPARYVCPPDCGRPPTGTPVTVNPRFGAADGTFSVSYPAPGSAYRVTTTDTGVTAEFQAGDGGTLRLFGEPAVGRSAEQIAKELVAKTFPDSRVAYELPNAMVGYQPGYGEVVDCWPQGSNSSYLRMRVLVMVAVKDGLALVAAATGPYREYGPDFGFGKPSGANTQIALDMGKYVNSFSWRGDPPR